MTWLLFALGWVKKAATAFLDLARRYPLQVALIASLCLSGWLWRGKQHAIAERNAARATIADMTAKAKAARQATIIIAKESDKAHEKRVSDNRGATVRYIERNRVQPQACVSAPAEGETAGSPESPAAEAIVAVSEADVQICATNYSYALSAYEWAKRLRDEGLAD